MEHSILIRSYRKCFETFKILNFKILNFTLKFINVEWWQQKEANLQNNTKTAFLSWLAYSKNKQINRTLKID